jgi:aryl-alcohol dehydrogenase-like predicted oxidoreductase
VHRRDAIDRRRTRRVRRARRARRLLHRPIVTSVIVGAKTIDQLDDNLAATTVALTADELAALDRVSVLPPEYPGWMIERQNAGRRPAP